MKASVKFRNLPVLTVSIDDTETGRLFFNLSQTQNAVQAPFFRDAMHYTPKYMFELAQQAKKAFGWNWVSDHYDISVTATLHKDLENYVGKLGFDQIPEEYDSLLYDLHHCLHAIQFGKIDPGRYDNLQIEWLTDESIPLPQSFEFVESTNYGDLILINPYVGHNPLQIYRENDFACIETTCKFHDIIKPGIVITTNIETVTKKQILDQFLKQVPEFVELHGADKILYYSGSAKIGHVENVDILRKIKNYTGDLELESAEFNE
jgi:hypothetical protein